MKPSPTKPKIIMAVPATLPSKIGVATLGCLQVRHLGRARVSEVATAAVTVAIGLGLARQVNLPVEAQ